MNSPIGVVEVTRNHKHLMQRLITVLFAGHKFPFNFFDSISTHSETPDSEYRDLVKLAYYQDVPVGCIVAKRQYSLLMEQTDIPVIYIQTVGVLAPYRRLGVGTMLIQEIVKEAQSLHMAAVELHVQHEPDSSGSLNTPTFYQQLGFKQMQFMPGYYQRVLKPNGVDCLDAWLMRLDL